MELLLKKRPSTLDSSTVIDLLPPSSRQRDSTGITDYVLLLNSDPGRNADEVRALGYEFVNKTPPKKVRNTPSVHGFQASTCTMTAPKYTADAQAVADPQICTCRSLASLSDFETSSSCAVSGAYTCVMPLTEHRSS